jgi:hypothetical protein
MTANQLTANVVTNLRFYRRNRLLVLVGLFVVVVFLITMVTTAVAASKKFEVVQACVSIAEWFLVMLAALLGLVTVSHHVRSRSLKLVVTHPCTMETWVLSHFVSATIVVVALSVTVAAVALVLFLAWDIPVQWGFVYVIAWGACTAMITFAFLLMLSTLVHPIVAAMIAAFFNPETVKWLLTLLQAQIEIGPDGFVRAVNTGLKLLLSALYYGLPAYTPFADRLGSLEMSYRIAPGDAYALFVTAAYTLVMCALMFFLTTGVLKRQRHI